MLWEQTPHKGSGPAKYRANTLPRTSLSCVFVQHATRNLLSCTYAQSWVHLGAGGARKPPILVSAGVGRCESIAGVCRGVWYTVRTGSNVSHLERQAAGLAGVEGSEVSRVEVRGIELGNCWALAGPGPWRETIWVSWGHWGLELAAGCWSMMYPHRRAPT